MTVLTRNRARLEGNRSIPSAAKILEVEYSSHEALVAAIRGHEVLICCLAMDIITLVQPRLLDAAIEAGVQRFVPSEYSGIILIPGSRDIPLLKPLTDVQAQLKSLAAEGKISYTIFAPGGFPYMFIEVLLDFTTHTASIYDGGSKPVSMTRVLTIAKGIASALQDSTKYANSVVRFHDGAITQREALVAAQQAAPEHTWDILNFGGKETIKAGVEALEKGASFQSIEVQRLMAAHALAKEHHFGWAEGEDKAKELGLTVCGSEGLLRLVGMKALGQDIKHVDI